MNRIIIATLALLAFACGEPAEDGLDQTEEEVSPTEYIAPGDEALDELIREVAMPVMKDIIEGNEIGTLKQPIFMPDNYGSQNGQVKCTNPFNGTCFVPDRRDLPIVVARYTCPTQQFKDQLLDGANHIRDIANARGWSVSVSTDDATPTNGHWVFQCQNSGGAQGQMGVTDMSETLGHPWDCHSTARGQLCQYRRALTTIFTNRIQAHLSWAGATQTQRNNYIENVVRHEGGHMLGYGHPPTNGATLMNNGDGTADRWNNLLTFTTDELFQVDCYNETSGTGSGC